ncbi:MAG: ribonuclease Z [Elusimicrobiota bacterium]|nr:ribonuclease Z [Elusimicrobiota bacterium]
MTIQIKFLGTGAAVATARRDNTSVLAVCGSKKILLDCPGSVVPKLAELNVDFRDINAVFISHFHPDHVYGLPSLIHSLKPGGIFPDIFVPEKLLGRTTDMLKIFNLGSTAKIIPVKAGDKMEKFNLSFFKTPHTKASLGAKIETKERTLVYTSDTGPLGGGAAIFRNADALIHDCYALSKFKKEIDELDKTHSSALSVGRIAAASGVKKLFCVHFSGEVDFSEESIIKEVRKNYPGEVIIPRDLDSYSI